MPTQGETRTTKDGVQEIYMIDTWLPVNGTKQKKEDDKVPKVDCEIKIGDNIVLKASARFKTFEKSGKKGVRVDLRPNQNFWGNGNFFLKSE